MYKDPSMPGEAICVRKEAGLGLSTTFLSASKIRESREIAGAFISC
jgi:hypothetical protein